VQVYIDRARILEVAMNASSPACVLAPLAALCAMMGAASAGAPPDAIFANGHESLPIIAPANTWTFVPIAGTRCGNNSGTGIGINPSSSGGARVLLLLSGGGACWDTLTCITLQTASNFNGGYGPAQFANDLPSLGSGALDRSSPTNPFRDFHYVFVPYCTGDLHFGSTPSIDYGGNERSHLGYHNLNAIVDRVIATFPNPGRVVLGGISAGGFGAALNWTRFQRLYGSVRVDMIDDSGQFMPAAIVPPASASEQARFASWNLASTLPADCSACFGGGLDNIYSHNANALPGNRGALLSFRPDPTIASFFQISTSSFTTGLNTMLTTRWDPFPNRHYFISGNSGHVLANNLALSVNGVSLETFLTRMVNDDPNWANVTP